MGKIERKIRQTIHREARADFQRIKESVAQHRPWWLPKKLWVRIVEAVLDSGVHNVKKGQING